MSRYKRKWVDKMIAAHSVAAAAYFAAAVSAYANGELGAYIMGMSRAREELKSAKYWDEIRKNKLRVK
jgi:hypothetical protein